MPFDDSYLDDNGFCNEVIAFRNKAFDVVNDMKDVKTTMFDVDFMSHMRDFCVYSYTDKYIFGLPKGFTWQVDFPKSCIFCNKAKVHWILNFNNIPLFIDYRKKFFAN